ncbi:hydroxyectoine utilization dehydratase EutB [Chelativorans sp.]|uniref:hydroxyectoine utilization dehydratase EutB n=1 Tax=Chelativorans sp. TaxID=2203393 RepID=UPI002811F7AE|nr:hydroxyectoine utilization dehydratase EutB [Chelativorans sp.]
MEDALVDISDIEAARRRIAGRVVETPIVPSPSLSDRMGLPVHLKLEHRQTTGAFKLRGASNALALLSADAKARGVVAASTGNHGRALAYAARLEGVRAVICMSRLVPANKVEEIRRLGAEVKIIGNSQDDAQEEVDRLVAEEGLAMIPPFDDPAVIAGQSTLGLELIDQLPDVDTVLVPVSGGGLAAGIAAAVKAKKPSASVIGVSMDRGAAMHASLAAGKPVLVEEAQSLADSLGGGIGLQNRLTFAMCRALLDDLVLLSEEEIAAGIRHLYAEEREIVEGAGSVGVGALLAGKVNPRGVTAIILSGRNIDMELHRRIVCGETTAATGGK